ncbi:hypothetical protein [Rhodobacter capsulatus]|nr:hypothetical protein [Rhodobacter capsulatus]WER10019.1 hypothetical protein PUH89_03235 [Rhodobacter capsulatus]
MPSVITITRRKEFRGSEVRAGEVWAREVRGSEVWGRVFSDI